ncbi:MAG: tRNA pseudouridine(38-40) synthase TruA [Deltaproteobacteria bacterium]
MRRVKLTIAYDGTAYRGFQVQPGAPTVQSAMETALSRLLQEPVRLRAAGRTDAGVHARRQVVDFADAGRRDLETILRGGNALLPPDIRILSAEEAPPDFDARRHATAKEYRYFLHLGRVASPFLVRYAWRPGNPIDPGALRNGLDRFAGEHDFSAFRGQGCTAKTTVRRILRAEMIFRPPALAVVVLVGTGFLRHMVRNIVGTLVETGRGRMSPEEIPAILASRDRTRAGPTAPPCGLFLWRVEYGDSPFPLDADEEVGSNTFFDFDGEGLRR